MNDTSRVAQYFEKDNTNDNQIHFYLHFFKAGLVDTSNDPVDDLEKGDDAESKTEAKEPSKGGNKVHRTHSDASLKLWSKKIID